MCYIRLPAATLATPVASVTFHIGFPVMRTGRPQSWDYENVLDGVTFITNFFSYGTAIGHIWSSAN